MQYGEDDRFCMMATDRGKDAIYMLEINADYVDPYNIIEKNYGRDIVVFVKNEDGVQTIYKIRKTYISRDDKTMDRVALVATKEFQIMQTIFKNQILASSLTQMWQWQKLG